MKKISFISLFISAAIVSIYLSSFTPPSHAASQRLYADPDADGYGTPNDYIVVDDSVEPSAGYIHWVSGHDNDNCPNVYNPDQADTNANGIGDACDSNTNTTIGLLNVNLNKIAPLADEIPDNFYISNIAYPVADFDAANHQLRPAHTLMHEILHSYYKNETRQDYVVELRLYDSILDAKAMFDTVNTSHARTVINLLSSETFGDDVFCHQAESNPVLNASQYFICGMRYKNLYVQIQATIINETHAPSLAMLRKIYTSAINYDSNRVHPTIGLNTPPVDTSVKLPDLSIEKMRISPTTRRLIVVVKNNTDIPLKRTFGLQIVSNGQTWQKEQFVSSERPLLGNQTIAVPIADLVSGSYDVQGTVDYHNLIEESNETNNTLSEHFNLTQEVMSNEFLPLRDRLRNLSYQISQSEQKVIDSETQMVQTVNNVLTNNLKGRILLQVEERGEAWYVDYIAGQKFYLKDGTAAYQALKAFGLGISNSDIEKIPVGFEDRFQDTDSDGDGLSDKIEEALGTAANNPDTDGDGYADGDEVRGHYSPLGPGTWRHDVSLANKLKGRILIQTEGRGQAWYVHPEDGKRYYMKDGQAAYQIMRFLSLGISNDNLRQIKVGSFE